MCLWLCERFQNLFFWMKYEIRHRQRLSKQQRQQLSSRIFNARYDVALSGWRFSRRVTFRAASRQIRQHAVSLSLSSVNKYPHRLSTIIGTTAPFNSPYRASGHWKYNFSSDKVDSSPWESGPWEETIIFITDTNEIRHVTLYARYVCARDTIILYVPFLFISRFINWFKKSPPNDSTNSRRLEARR